MALDLFWAFLVGGALCAVGQVLIDYTKLTPARILTAYVVAGVALSAVGLYPWLVELAGGGAIFWQRASGNPWTKRAFWASLWADSPHPLPALRRRWCSGSSVPQSFAQSKNKRRPA